MSRETEGGKRQERRDEVCKWRREVEWWMTGLSWAVNKILHVLSWVFSPSPRLTLFPVNLSAQASC